MIIFVKQKKGVQGGDREKKYRPYREGLARQLCRE